MGRNVWIVKPGTNSKGSGIETPAGKNILLLVFCWSFFVACCSCFCCCCFCCCCGSGSFAGMCLVNGG